MRSYVRNVPSLLLSVCILGTFCAFLAFPARYLNCVADGVTLWATSVLPAALPFLFLTGLLSQTPLFSRFAKWLSPVFRLFGVSGAGGCATLLSLLSGYPAGAKTVERLCNQGRLCEEERLRCACLASTSGPAFLVGVAGAAMMQSAALGWLLFFSHVTGILGVSFVLGFKKRREKHLFSPPQIPRTNMAQLVPETLASSVLSVLCVGGAVAVFYAFGCMLSDALAPLSLSPTLTGTLAGLLEMTAGCSRLLASPTPLTLAIAAFLVTFGGVCVLVQQWSFLYRTGIPLGKFLLVKLLQALLAAIICFALACLVL